MKKDTRIEDFIAKHQKWTEGLSIIRAQLLDTELVEDIKWGMPTYRLDGKNVISFAGFKNHFGLWFHNGSFLSDKRNLLENAQEGKTRRMRHLKYTSNDQVDPSIITEYILEAIQNQKDGKEIKIIPKKEAKPIPEVLTTHLSKKAVSNLKKLSLSKRNEYIVYITTAKRDATVLKRLEKINPMLEAGIGLNDMYK